MQVTIFNSPFTVKRAVTNTAFYAQDTYSIGRLTVIAGIRWERVEGYIPAQTHESSQYFPSGTMISGLNVALNTGGTLTQLHRAATVFDEVHERAAVEELGAARQRGTYDLTGNGKTVLRVSCGKYLDQIGTGTPGPNPNGAIARRYTWNDINGDLAFQPGNADLGRHEVRRRRVRRAGEQRHDGSQPQPIRSPRADLSQRGHGGNRPRDLQRRQGQRDLHSEARAQSRRRRSSYRWINGRRHMFPCRLSIREWTASPATQMTRR